MSKTSPYSHDVYTLEEDNSKYIINVRWLKESIDRRLLSGPVVKTLASCRHGFPAVFEELRSCMAHCMTKKLYREK